MELNAAQPVKVEFGSFISNLGDRGRDAVLYSVKKLGETFGVDLSPLPEVSVSKIPTAALLRQNENLIEINENRINDSGMDNAIAVTHEVAHKAMTLYYKRKSESDPIFGKSSKEVTTKQAFGLAVKVVLGEGLAELCGDYFVNQADETSALTSERRELQFFTEYFLLSRCMNYKIDSFEESISDILDFKEKVSKGDGGYAIFERLLLDLNKLARGAPDMNSQCEVKTRTGTLIVGLALYGYAELQPEERSMTHFILKVLEGDLIFLTMCINSAKVDALKVGLKEIWNIWKEAQEKKAARKEEA
jgi:hypothetical protein